MLPVLTMASRAMMSRVSENLTRGARGAGAIMGFQIFRLALQLGSVPILARLLGPESFGLVAMVAVAVALGDLVRDFGLSTAALQSSRLTNQQASNLFWLNGALGAALAIAVAASAPLLVLIYDEPRLNAIAPVMALTLLFNGLQVQIIVHLARARRFFATGAIETAAQIGAIAIAIGGALAGWEQWALVAQLVVNSLLLFLIGALVARWIPAWFKRGQGTRRFVTEGIRYGGAYLLSYLASSSPNAVMGIRFTATQVGYFDRAYQLLLVPVSRLLTPLNRVVLPTLSSEREHRARLFAILLRIQSTIGIAGAAVYGTALGAAGLLVAVVLGPQWEESAPLFAILAIGGAFSVLSHANYWGFIAFEKSSALLKSNLVTKPLTVALVVIGSFVSVEGVAVGFALGQVLGWPVGLWWLRSEVGMPVKEFLASGMKAVLLGSIAAAAAAGVASAASGWPAFTALLVAAASGTGAVAAVVMLMPRTRRQLLEVGALIRKRPAR